ncbi:hypothetical protein E2C01_095306 [Portunus trituberculatus]|uniref:Uncharacterized protein n=1 Tax=Portunus trituberculatus TaxID=210409 RepID=A0A5B7JZU1_PORTR|nr:hypothetical protein [Portunus trituberculatus]
MPLPAAAAPKRYVMQGQYTRLVHLYGHVGVNIAQLQSRPLLFLCCCCFF